MSERSTNPLLVGLDPSGQDLSWSAAVPTERRAQEPERRAQEPERSPHGARRALSSSADAERLLAITAALADAVDSEDVFEAVVDHLAQALEASTAALWLVDESAASLRLVRARGYDEHTYRHLDAVPLDASASFPALDSVRRREPIWISSRAELLKEYPQLRSLAKAERPYRVACLPLLARGRILGVLGITLDEARAPSTAEREFLGVVARYVSQGLERVRLLELERLTREQAERAAARLGVLSHASRLFADTELSLPARLHAISQELSVVLDSCVSITLMETDGLLHFTSVYHPESEARALLRSLAPAPPQAPGEGVAGRIAAARESLLLPALDAQLSREHAPLPYPSFFERFPAYALIGAPLCLRGRVLGTVTAARVRPGQTYTRDDLRLLEELAERAAIAVENSRLHAETALARMRAEQLYRFAQAAVDAATIEAVYEAALSAIQAALCAGRAAILLFGPDGVMRFKAWHGISATYRAAVEGHSPWAADTPSPPPVVVCDARRDGSWSSYRELFEQENIGALAFIPLVSSSRLLGKFMVYHHHPHTFSRQELETAGAIGNHLASVITRFTVRAELEDTIRQNELFTGVLAHDLRNPLGAIITGAQLLLSRGAAGAATDDTGPLARILASGRRMTTMINQLLDFTRARSGGGLALEPRATDLGDLLQQASAEVMLAHPDWKLEYSIRGDPSGEWDPERLLQVMSNLLANAGQHGKRGAVIRVVLDGSQPQRVGIEVRNEGVIAPSLLPVLFDPFRGSRYSGGRSSGLGLGLFIVREIVVAHGGSVEVVSDAENGTIFRIALPRYASGSGAGLLAAASGKLKPGTARAPGGMASSEAASPSSASSQERESASKLGKLLIVDDDLDVRDALAELLEYRGFSVDTAANGAEALASLRSGRPLPGAILLDLMMPVMDGYEFLEARRQAPELASIPVVAITAGHRIDRGRLGSNVTVVTKPISVPQLMSALPFSQPEGAES